MQVKKENAFDAFLSGLAEDLRKREPSIPILLKWGILLVAGYFFLPVTVALAILIFWRRARWNVGVKVFTTLGIMFIGMLMILLRFAGNTEELRPADVSPKSAITSVQDQMIDTMPEVVVTTEEVAGNIEEATENPVEGEWYVIAGVTDGDTFKVEIDGVLESIRLIGIDTPETVDPRKPVQCFGKEASVKAHELLDGKRVRLESDTTQGDRDTYGRLLRYAYLEDGAMFNEQMIAEGYAHEYTYQSNPYQYQERFQEAERNAREGKKGLWADDTCGGNTIQEAVTAAATVVGGVLAADATKTTASESAATFSDGVVKKNSTGICHAPGTTYYEKTKTYTSYDTVDACLASGGRLPKR